MSVLFFKPFAAVFKKNLELKKIFNLWLKNIYGKNTP
jgi:hypothetical protein